MNQPQEIQQCQSEQSKASQTIEEDSYTRADHFCHGSDWVTSSWEIQSCGYLFGHKMPQFIKAWKWQSDQLFFLGRSSRKSLLTVSRKFVWNGLRLQDGLSSVLEDVSAGITINKKCVKATTTTTKKITTFSGKRFSHLFGYITCKTHHNIVVKCESLKLQRLLSAREAPCPISSDTCGTGSQR